jgi:hypothetical protein
VIASHRARIDVVNGQHLDRIAARARYSGAVDYRWVGYCGAGCIPACQRLAASRQAHSAALEPRASASIHLANSAKIAAHDFRDSLDLPAAPRTGVLPDRRTAATHLPYRKASGSEKNHPMALVVACFPAYSQPHCLPELCGPALCRPVEHSHPRNFGRKARQTVSTRSGSSGAIRFPAPADRRLSSYG